MCLIGTYQNALRINHFVLAFFSPWKSDKYSNFKLLLKQEIFTKIGGCFWKIKLKYERKNDLI